MNPLGVDRVRSSRKGVSGARHSTTVFNALLHVSYACGGVRWTYHGHRNAQVGGRKGVPGGVQWCEWSFCATSALLRQLIARVFAACTNQIPVRSNTVERVVFPGKAR